jgi:hypothetical protein
VCGAHNHPSHTFSFSLFSKKAFDNTRELLETHGIDQSFLLPPSTVFLGPGPAFSPAGMPVLALGENGPDKRAASGGVNLDPTLPSAGLTAVHAALAGPLPRPQPTPPPKDDAAWAALLDGVGGAGGRGGFGDLSPGLTGTATLSPVPPVGNALVWVFVGSCC